MRGHITQRSAGSWTIQASGGFDDAGKRVRITRTVRGSRTTAERALTALLREVDTGQAVANGSTTLGRYLAEAWLPHMRTRVRPKTWNRYEGLSRLHIVPVAGRVKLGALRPHHLQTVLDRMTAEGASAASVLKTHRMVHQALAQAVRWQVLAVNPAAAVSPPRVDRSALRVPDASKVRELLAAAKGGPYHTPLLLLATAGLRRGEVLAIHWSDVDLETGRVRIVASLQKVRGEVSFVPPKTDRSRRTVSLPPSVVEHLRRYRKEQNERRLLTGVAWHDEDLVVDRGDGSHLDPDTLSGGFERLATRVGLDGVRLHDLRHAFATTLLTAGVHPKVVSEALGHSSVAFTMDTYQHVLPTMGDQVAEAIESVFGAKTGG